LTNKPKLDRFRLTGRMLVIWLWLDRLVTRHMLLAGQTLTAEPLTAYSNWTDSDWTASWLESLWLDIYSERDRLAGHALALAELDLPEMIQTGHPLIWQAVPQQALNEWFQTELVLTGLRINRLWHGKRWLYLFKLDKFWINRLRIDRLWLNRLWLHWFKRHWLDIFRLNGLCLDRLWNTFLLRRW